MSDDVVIVGAGPNGLMLAAELALAGIRPTVLERLPEPSPLPKSNGLVGEVVRLLEYRGVLKDFARGATHVGPVPSFRFGPLSLDLTRTNSQLLILPVQQQRLEQLLTERARQLGVRIERDRELVDLTQDADGVTLDIAGQATRTTRYLVGCDGARSVVRKRAGIGFPGYTSTEVSRIGRVTLPGARHAGRDEAEVPGFGRLKLFQPTRTAHGSYSAAPLSQLDKSAPPDVYIISTHEPGTEPDTPMTLDELRASVRRVLGADLDMRDPQWLTRTVGNSRLADRFRVGRVFLAGDAAHLFSAGGTGLNSGMLDAANLAWKLAAELQGWAPPALLDTYHTERHAAGHRTLMTTRAQHALSGAGEDTAALRDLVTELLTYSEPLNHVAALV
ncbi:MAG TPA: FAD-dependent monooxygenase, partial [Pseudonocardiaceae bacterium]|nr:FAD-dependent monooxygenase [Pseudonocardiaceae bacterium]